MSITVGDFGFWLPLGFFFRHFSVKQGNLEMLRKSSNCHEQCWNSIGYCMHDSFIDDKVVMIWFLRIIGGLGKFTRFVLLK